MQALMQKELTQVSGGNITITLDPNIDWSKLIGKPVKLIKDPTDPIIIIPRPPKPPVYEM